MTKSGYRPLPILPQVGRTAETTTSSKRSGSGPVEGEHIIIKKRRSVTVACGSCRVKKLACDGRRPLCGRCATKNLPCEYMSKGESETRVMARKREMEDLRAKLKQHADILNRLRVGSEADALAVLHMLQKTPDVAAVHAALNSSVMLTRPSAVKAARAVAPTTYSSIEFELATLHKAVYPTLAPAETGSIDLVDVVDFSIRSSTVPAQALPSTDKGKAAASTEAQTIDPKLINNKLLPFSQDSDESDNNMDESWTTPVYCDDRLSRVKIGFWTNVPISDAHAAAAISFYLKSDYGINGFFDADLFLDDFLSPRLENCSAFLVNALLCLACLGYSACVPRVAAYSRKFLHEAIRLWRADRTTNSIVTLVGTNLLSMAAFQIGQDQIALEATSWARCMGEAMGLFGVASSNSRLKEYRQLTDSKLRATAYAAWSTYSWMTLHSLFFHEEPIAFPPYLPIPGDLDKASLFTPPGDWHPIPVPSHMGHMFSMMCKFWVIVQEMMAVYLGPRGSNDPREIALAFAEAKYQKLLYWSDEVEKCMAVGNVNKFHILVFQTMYHTVVADMFRPFLRSDRDTKLRMRSFASADSSPLAIYVLSTRHLRRLLLKRSHQSDPSKYSHMLIPATIMISNKVVHQTDDPQWKFWFLLCARFWKEVAVECPVALQFAEASLSVAMNIGCVSGTEARKLMGQIKANSQQNEHEEITTSAIFDFNQAILASGEYRTNELAAKFVELSLPDDLTTTNCEPRTPISAIRSHRVCEC